MTCQRCSRDISLNVFKFIDPNVLTAAEAEGRPLDRGNSTQVVHIFARFLHTICQSSLHKSLFKVNLHTKKIYLPCKQVQNASLLSPPGEPTKCVATAKASLHNVTACFLDQQFPLGTLDRKGTIGFEGKKIRFQEIITFSPEIS